MIVKKDAIFVCSVPGAEQKNALKDTHPYVSLGGGNPKSLGFSMCTGCFLWLIKMDL